jgi:hypothetical protein
LGPSEAGRLAAAAFADGLAAGRPRPFFAGAAFAPFSSSSGSSTGFFSAFFGDGFSTGASFGCLRRGEKEYFYKEKCVR